VPGHSAGPLVGIKLVTVDYCPQLQVGIFAFQRLVDLCVLRRREVLAVGQSKHVVMYCTGDVGKLPRELADYRRLAYNPLRPGINSVSRTRVVHFFGPPFCDIADYLVETGQIRSTDVARPLEIVVPVEVSAE